VTILPGVRNEEARGSNVLSSTQVRGPFRTIGEGACTALRSKRKNEDCRGLKTSSPYPNELLLKALIYCALTADVDGRAVEVEQRLDEILTRYGNGHVVDRPIRRSALLLRTVVGSVRPVASWIACNWCWLCLADTRRGRAVQIGGTGVLIDSWVTN
jgi:hypothetical protein